MPAALSSAASLDRNASSTCRLQRIEQSEGVVRGNFATVLKIQNALGRAGIHFTDDEAGEIGVRLQISKRRMKVADQLDSPGLTPTPQCTARRGPKQMVWASSELCVEITLTDLIVPDGFLRFSDAERRACGVVSDDQFRRVV
jgi:hypothetical protein